MTDKSLRQQMEREDWHLGHNVSEFPACNIHNGLLTCWDCGENVVACKYPIEYIYVSIDIGEENNKETLMTNNKETLMTTKEQTNLNKLLGLLKHRLQSSAKVKTADACGNTSYEDADVYADEQLTAFITLAISDFNQTPNFSAYTLADGSFIDTFAEVLTEGAAIQAMLSQALVERGREFSLIDGGEEGMSFTPPAVSEMLTNQAQMLLGVHREKLKHIKGWFPVNTYVSAEDAYRKFQDQPLGSV